MHDNTITREKINILFNAWADADNFNAQSLNAREIALRLDPQRFKSTLFYDRKPDNRLLKCPSTRLIRLPHRIKTLRILKEMIRDYDLIFYMDLSPSSYLYLHLPKFTRRKTTSMFSVEGLIEGNLQTTSNTIKKYARYVLSHCDVRTAISEFISRDTEATRGDKIHFVVPVGVDTKTFSPPTKRSNRDLTILFVGHLIERKGPHLVLEAARRLPHVKFRLVGAPRGDFYKTLHHAASKWHLTNVTFDEPGSQSRLAEIMRQSDILLLPSRVEGMPKVTLEAAATGLPCVIFDDYQTPSVVDNVTGFQVRTFGEMMDRLQRLIEDESLRLGMESAAIKHAEQFDWNIITKRWEQVFLQIIRSPTRD